MFRAELAAPFAPPSAGPQRLQGRTAAGLAGAGSLAVIYLIASALSWPLGVVAAFGAVLLVTLGRRG